MNIFWRYLHWGMPQWRGAIPQELSKKDVNRAGLPERRVCYYLTFRGFTPRATAISVTNGTMVQKKSFIGGYCNFI